MSSVYDEFKQTCAIAADKPFLHIPAIAAQGYCSEAIDLSYGEALEQIQSCSQQYKEKGYGNPMRVAILLENRAEFFIHWLALNRLGCSVLPIANDLQDEEICYYLEHGKPVLVVTLPKHSDRISKVGNSLTKAPPVISCDDLINLPAAQQARNGQAANAETECALLYTSGSTGKPKGCILSNEYFTLFGAWYKNIGGLAKLKWGEERLLTPLPLTHMNALACSGMGMIMTAGCIIQLDRFHPKSWWQAVRESKATVLHYLGVLPAILLNMPPGNDDFSKQIRFGFGAGVNPKHHAAFEQRFGFPLIESWAMTECGAGGCISATHEPRHVGTSCFGVPGSDIEYQLVDESKVPVSKGQDGELRVRAAGDNPGLGFFSGYLKNSEATDEAWQDGWLNTGDVVREGEDGSLHFVDRRKNVIRRSGENISALEVESVLSLDENIKEALVTAVPDEIRGDEVAACIILHREDTNSQDVANDIVNRCLQSLAYYKAPGYIIFCDKLPKTASNKPQRGELKSTAKSLLGSKTCVDVRHLKKRQQVDSK